MRIYIASQTKHAEKWLELRKVGLNIVATWIDEAGAGASPDLTDLSSRCIFEATQADWLILYCETEDFLKGALLEAGAALGAGVPVICVGNCKSISPTFEHHPLWFRAETIDEALKFTRSLMRSS